MSTFGTLPHAGRLLMVVGALHLVAAAFAALSAIALTGMAVTEIALAALALAAGLVLQAAPRWTGWLVMLALIVAIGLRLAEIGAPPVPDWVDLGIAGLDLLAALGLFVALWHPAPEAAA